MSRLEAHQAAVLRKFKQRHWFETLVARKLIIPITGMFKSKISDSDGNNIQYYSIVNRGFKDLRT